MSVVMFSKNGESDKYNIGKLDWALRLRATWCTSTGFPCHITHIEILVGNGGCTGSSSPVTRLLWERWHNSINALPIDTKRSEFGIFWLIHDPSKNPVKIGCWLPISLVTWSWYLECLHLQWKLRGYSSSLRHMLQREQWSLKHKMSSSCVIVCFFGWRAHEKLFPKALIMNQCLKNELYESKSNK